MPFGSNWYSISIGHQRNDLKSIFTFLTKSPGFKSLKADSNGAELMFQVPYPPPCASHALPEHTQPAQANATAEGAKPPTHKHHHDHPQSQSGLGTLTLISLFRLSSDAMSAVEQRDAVNSVALATLVVYASISAEMAALCKCRQV
jgi:hypothetical protein